jgi:hypothetical protein
MGRLCYFTAKYTMLRGISRLSYHFGYETRKKEDDAWIEEVKMHFYEWARIDEL